jgi:putative DNA primase/helicase
MLTAEQIERQLVNHDASQANLPVENPESAEWPEPQPLAAKVEPEPYPVDALPEVVRAAVIEVQQFTKAPVPLVASSALAALSLAIQAHVDVKRADMLAGPVGLFLLTIADSGERKSTCDGLFTGAIRNYETQQAEAAKPKVKEYKAALDAWEAKRAGIKDKIRQLAKDKKPTDEHEKALGDLEHRKPESPRTPRLIYADATPEALKWNLAMGWPSAGVVCAEAGIVFGSHGMGKDSIMRNLTTLNELWDGRSISTDRRTSESFTVRGARLTLALQVQEATLRGFFDRSKGLARGTGFLARFLIAWPESTQGFRRFTEPPSSWPALDDFNRRVIDILNKPFPIGDDGGLSPSVLLLAPEAKTAWITFHNAIESELAHGGELYDVRDVASKSADNAARLAALFQVFEYGMGGAVVLAAFEGASRIVAWHLNESRRFFGEIALPAELANAARLDSWLIEYCRRNRTSTIPTKTVQQYGPSGLREKSAIESALRELEELSRARLAGDGRRRVITVNPALVMIQEGEA